MPLTLPEPEALPNADLVRYVAPRGNFPMDLRTLDFVRSLDERAEALVSRLYGEPGRAPHGFYELVDFVEASRRRSARKRVAAMIRRHLADKAIRRGQLVVVANDVDNRGDWVAVPGDWEPGKRVRKPTYCYERKRIVPAQQGSCGAVIGCCEHTAHVEW